MNAVDIYRMQNNQFDWMELFNIADDKQLQVIDYLLKAEILKRQPASWDRDIYKQTQYPGVWVKPRQDDRIYVGDFPDEVVTTNPIWTDVTSPVLYNHSHSISNGAALNTSTSTTVSSHADYVTTDAYGRSRL